MTHLPEGKDQLWAFVNTATNLQFPTRAGNCLTSWLLSPSQEGSAQWSCCRNYCCHLWISYRLPQCKNLTLNSRNSSSSISGSNLYACCRLHHTEHVQLAYMRWSDRNSDTTTQTRRAAGRCCRRRCMWDCSTLAYPRSPWSSPITLLQVSTSRQQSGALCWRLHSLKPRTKSRRMQLSIPPPVVTQGFAQFWNVS